MANVEVRAILEGILFVSSAPVKLETFLEVLRETTRETIEEELRRIREECGVSARGIELVEVAGGYQFRTKPDCAEWLARLKKAKTVKFSASALETLAIVAYRQPVIRPQIEGIRGVDSGWVLRSLMEKGLVRIMGRKDLPGRPMIYGTTKAFLELFNLNSLEDLPSLREIQPPPPADEGQRIVVEDEGRSEAEDVQAAAEVRVEGEAAGEGEASDRTEPQSDTGADMAQGGEPETVTEGTGNGRSP